MATNDSIKFQLDGADEIINALNALPAKIIVSLLRSVNRTAETQYIVKNLRSSIPYSANIKRNIKVESDRNDKTGVIAGPSSDVFWTRFLEKGTKQRKTKTGANRGSIIGNHTIEPIIDQNVPNIIDFINNNLGKEISKFLEKRIKKLNK